MNRKIIFRGWNKKHSEWRYGYYFVNRGIHFVVEDKVEENPFLTEDDFCVEPETIGQFTGLKDKNGKEIYEGDIVRHRGYNGIKTSAVVFSNGCFNVGRHQGSSTKETPMLITANGEIIGNIHDNPEMMKGGK